MSQHETLIEVAVAAYVSRPSEKSERDVLELLSEIPPDRLPHTHRSLLRKLGEQHARLAAVTSPPLRTGVVFRVGIYAPKGHSAGGPQDDGRADGDGGPTNGGAADGPAPLALVRLLPGGAQALCAVAPGLDLEVGDLVAITSDGGAILDRVTSFHGADIGSVERVKTDTGEVVIRGANDDEIVVTAAPRVLKDPQLKKGCKVRYGRTAEIATLVEEECDTRSDALADHIPDLTWDDLGGMRDIRDRFMQVEQRLVTPAEELAEFGLTKRVLLLLTGRPGCGKSYCAKILCASLRHRLGHDRVVFIIRRAADDLSPLVGVSEANIRRHFERSRALAERGYYVVFTYDEFEGLFPHRGNSHFSTIVENTLTDTLLAELDGMAELDNFVMLALTNRPDMVDSALLRDRRFGEQIVFRAPDWPDCQQIFRIHLAGRPCATGTSIDELAERGAARIFTPQSDGSGSPAVAVVRFDDGRTEEITRAQLVTGALIQAACDAAAERAWLRSTKGGPKGIATPDVLAAVDAAFVKYPTSMRGTNLVEYVDWPRDKAARVVAVDPPASGHGPVAAPMVEAA